MVTLKVSLKSDRLVTYTMILLIGTALFIYVCLRSYFIGFTHDESLNFQFSALLSPWRLIIYDMASPGTNHLLNSLGMQAFGMTFGYSEFSLRLPNVLFFPVYLIFSFLILCEFSSLALLCGFILIGCNPFILEYFAVSRGYGIGMGLMMVSLYYFKESIKEAYSDASLDGDRITGYPEVISSIFISLAVISNFCFLYVLVPLQSWFLLSGLSKVFKLRKVATSQGRKFLSQFFMTAFIPTLITSAFLGSFVLFPLIKIALVGDLYFGGTNAFWTDTVKSLIRVSFYGQENWLVENFAELGLFFLLSILLVLLLLALLTFIILTAKKQSGLVESFLKTVFPWLWIILGSAFLSNCLHYLIGIKFLIERTAIFYLPLFTLVSISILEFSRLSINQKWAKKFAISLMILIAVLSSINLLVCLNLSYTLTCKFNADDKLLLDDMYAHHQKTGKPVVLSISGLHIWNFQYYQMTRGLDWLKLINANHEKVKDTEEGDVFYYITVDVGSANQGIPESKSLVLLKTYPLTGNMLKEEAARMGRTD